MDKKKGPAGPSSVYLSSGPKVELPQSCSHPSGNLLSSSSNSFISNSEAITLKGWPIPMRFLLYQLTRLRTSLAINFNSASEIFSYKFFILAPLLISCSGLRGGITVKYNDDGNEQILYCETKEEKKANEKTENVPPPVKKALQK